MPVPGQEQPDSPGPGFLPDFIKDIPEIDPMERFKKDFERIERELEKEKQREKVPLEKVPV